MILQILTLLIRTLFGRGMHPVPPPVEPIVIDFPSPTEPRDLDPVSPIPGHHHPPGLPADPGINILVPDPAHQDNHGPASAIARAMLAKGHVIFDKDARPYNLNIVAIRSHDHEFDTFGCRLAHFSKHNGQWSLESWPATTLPGKRYMIDKFLNPAGCAILCPGQLRGVYRLDRHRGIYEALCQRGGPVRVYRDKNRDRVYDLDPATIQSGSFGINVHATENPDDGISNPVADRIGSASAGCIVFARVNDFVDARTQWRMGRSLYGNSFSLTLLDETDIDDLGETPLVPTAPQHSAPETWTPPGPATVGTRNRNLLNVKQNPKNPWQYSTGADSRSHTIFPTYAAGIRAAIITLRTYWTTHNLRTLADITGRWAPASDTVGSIPGGARNRPDQYAEFLAKRLGIGPRDTLMTFHPDGTIRSADQLFLLVAAMAEMENGNHIKLPRSVFDAGLALV